MIPAVAVAIPEDEATAADDMAEVGGVPAAPEGTVKNPVLLIMLTGREDRR